MLLCLLSYYNDSNWHDEPEEQKKTYSQEAG